MVKVLTETENVIRNNELCKSAAQKSGTVLRKAHYELGLEIGNEISQALEEKKESIAVFVMMRAGLPFGLGIADSLEQNGKKVSVLFSGRDDLDFRSYDSVIVADAVINTGKSIIQMLENAPLEKVIIAANVMSEEGCTAMNQYSVFASRVSTHSYKGSAVKTISNGKGPDTGDRLFNSSFFS